MKAKNKIIMALVITFSTTSFMSCSKEIVNNKQEEFPVEFANQNTPDAEKKEALQSFLRTFEGSNEQLTQKITETLQSAEVGGGWGWRRLRSRKGGFGCPIFGRDCQTVSFLAGPVFDNELNELQKVIDGSQVAEYFGSTENWIGLLPSLSVETETISQLTNGVLGVSIFTYFDPSTENIFESSIVIIHKKPSGTTDLSMEDIVLGYPVTKVSLY